MSSNIQKTKEELRNYDIFKGIVAILIGILLLLSTLLGGPGPDNVASSGTDTGSTAATSTEEPAAGEEGQAIEISAPVLVVPQPGSELTAGPVPFSGTGTQDSQVAIMADSRELGRTPVNGNGDWELVVEMEPGIEEIVLQALDSEGAVAASSDPIPFTVSEGAEEIAFSADPLPEASDGVIVISGSGPPGYSVSVSLNGKEAASSEIDEDGAWSSDVNTGGEAAEVSANLISPAGENVETISVGQIEAPIAAPEIDTPGEEVTAGQITLTGTGQPGATISVSSGGDELGTAVVGEDGTWSLDTSLPEGDNEVEAVMLDEDGNPTEPAASLTLTLSAPPAPEVVASRLSLPVFSALTGALDWSGESEPDSQVALLVNGEPVEIVTADSDGNWALNVTLDPGTQEIAFGRLDEDGNILSQTEPQTIEVPGQFPRLTLPEFSLPDNLLALAGQAPGETAGDTGSTGAATEQERLLAGIDLDGIELPTLLLPAGLIEWNGRAEPGSEVVFLVDGDTVDQTTVGEDGGFSFTSDIAGDGEHTIQLAIPGEDGDLVAESSELQLKIADLDLPTIEIPQGAGEGETVTVSGSAGAGEMVEITADGETVGEATADENGRWSLELDSLPDATNLRAQLVGGDGIPILQSIPLFLAGLAGGETAAEETAAASAEEAVVSGTITSPDQEVLPEDALITVQIQDISRQDAQAVVIGEQTIEAGGQQLPITYEVAYDPAEIDERFTYGTRVRIEDGDGNLLFTNDTSVPVITNGNPTENVEVPVIPVGATVATAEEPGEASVTGTVTYQERIALPEDAVVTVQLQDISTPGSAAAVLGEQTIETGGQQVPIPFEISYDPANIVDNHTYSISARISDSAGNPLFVTDSANPVITNDSPTEDVQIVTSRVNTAVSDVVLQESEDLIGEDGQSAIAAAEGSGNFTTLLDGLQSAGLTETLQDVEGEYTLFAPTDEAFNAIPPELADAWEAYPESYRDLMQFLVVEGKYTPDDLTDGQVLTSLAGKDIQIAREGDLIYANGVPVLDYAEVGNSIVYAMPQIILPLLSLNENLPIIDESGVPTFVGPLLTVVGLGEPGSEILLTVDGEKFGEIATVEPNGFWLVKENVESGVRYILAYMFGEDGILQGISQEVVLPVP